MEVAGTAALCPAVARGRLDLALCSPPPAGAEPAFEPLFLERLDLLVPSRHPLARVEVVRARDLTPHQLLVTEESCAYRQVLLQVLSARGVTAGQVMEIGSIRAWRVRSRPSWAPPSCLWPDWSRRPGPCAGNSRTPRR